MNRKIGAPVACVAIIAAIACVVGTKAFAAGGNAVAGQHVFARCAACHSTDPGRNGIGPSLAQVFGRKSGAVDGYAYSSAMKSAGIVWDDGSLDKFLQEPNGLVHGTKMFANLVNAKDRSNVIAYLKTLHP